MQFSQLPPCRPPAGSVGGTVPPPIISPIAGRKARVVIMLTFYHEFMGASDPIKAEDVHSPFLAITVHLQEDFELSSRDHDAAQAVADGLRDAQGRQHPPRLPNRMAPLLRVNPHHRPAINARRAQRVALYLNHLAADGKAIATIAQARSAISHAHAAQGIPQTETSASRSPQPPAAPPRARSAITTTTCSPTRRQQPSQDHDPSGQRKPHPALSQQQRPGTAPGLPRERGLYASSYTRTAVPMFTPLPNGLHRSIRYSV